MTCDETEDLLLDFVERTLEPAQTAAVQQHLDGCAACRVRLRETRDIVGALSHLRQQPSAVDDTLAPPPSRHEPPTLLGKRIADFEIISELGRGGMGVVYRARQISLNRDVALKILPAGLIQGDAGIRRFQREAQAAARLHHTNIVAVYSQAEHDGLLFYAMERIDGVSLDVALRDPESWLAPETETSRADDASHASITRHRRDFRRLARVFGEVADALDHAHRQGILHRDIKPQNLLLGGDGKLHITDFGLARIFDEPAVTVTGEMVGTPAYMAPEQLEGDRHKISARTDIYALGVTLYETLTGRRPFEGANRAQVTARIMTREPTSPRRLNRHIPLDLETICLRALEKNPARRYPTAGDMATDLRRFADDVPILSRRVGPIERAFKWVRRHPAATTVIALSAALLLAIAGLGWQSVRERHRRANQDVAKVFEKLAYDNYQIAGDAFDVLNRAARAGADPVPLRTTRALAHLMDDRGAAIRILKDLLAEHPDELDAGYLLAWALRLDDQFTEQLRWVDRADRAGGPRTAAGHFFRAQALVRHRPDDAANSYRRAIELQPRNTQAMLHLARAFNYWMYQNRSNARFTEQVQLLQSACTLQIDKAYPRYLLSIAYRRSAEVCTDAGDHETAEQRFQLALQAARDAQRAEPDSSRGYAAEAEYWDSRGDVEQAIRAWDNTFRRIERRNYLSELFEYRWRACYWSGRYDRALADLAELAKVCPETDPKRFWTSSLFPALVHADAGREDEALRAARRAVEMDPSSPRALISSVCALLLLGHGDEIAGLVERTRGSLDYSKSLSTDVDAPQTEVTVRAWTDAVRAQRAAPHRTLATQPADRRRAAPIWVAAGVHLLSSGQRDAALDWLRQAERAGDDEDFCYLARVILVRAERDANWPLRRAGASTRPTPSD
ncbi:MAG: protein kinase [Phycisphaerae bacterium]|nr:protein kinase [Phycisphaerae bacterium]